MLLTVRIFTMFLAATTIAPHSWAGSANRNCLQRHIHDAIKLNEARAPIYAQASGGLSKPLSKKLIQAERRSGLKASVADTWARVYQRAGINVLCQDLVDMKHSPALPPHFDPKEAPDARDFKNLSIEDVQQDLFEALAISYQELQERTAQYLQLLSQEPKLNCMTRHFLESIYKFAENAPGYLQHPQAKRFQSLNYFLKLSIKNQIKGLDHTHELDLMAIPVQTKGIGILCLDVPPIKPAETHEN